MLSYTPAPRKLSLSQIAPSISPPPSPNVLMTGYEGVPGVLETVFGLGIAAAATVTGIHVGLTSKDKYMKTLGWVGGVGAALLGLLYLGTKSGVGNYVGLPAIRFSPS